MAATFTQRAPVDRPACPLPPLDEQGVVQLNSTKATWALHWSRYKSPTFGFKDDVEFLAKRSGRVEVRSASRQGDSDLGINSKRLDFLRSELGKKGWASL